MKPTNKQKQRAADLVSEKSKELFPGNNFNMNYNHFYLHDAYFAAFCDYMARMEDTSNDLAIAREAVRHLGLNPQHLIYEELALRALSLFRSGWTPEPAPDPRIAVAREILRRAMLAIGDGCAAAAWAEDEPVSERDRLVAEAMAACLPKGMTIDDLPPVKGDVL